MFSEAGFGTDAATRLSRRSRRAAAAAEDLEADRAGDDVLRPRTVGQPRAACARLHGVRRRRRVEAGRRCSRPTAPSRGGRSYPSRPRARCATCSSSRRCRAARRRRRRSPAIASPARPEPRARSKAANTRDKYVASFVGMAPVSNPRLIVAVMIDEPSSGGYYGGTVAGPVFSGVMGAALRMLGVPTDAPVDNVVLPPPRRQRRGAERGRRDGADVRGDACRQRCAPRCSRRAGRASARRHHGRQPSRKPRHRVRRLSRAARDGRAYIGDAIARGAAAILFEARGFDWDAGWRVPHVAVADLKARLGFIASAVYGRPSQALWMIGVTGTNGKTSCAHWTAQALARLRPSRGGGRHARQRLHRRAAAVGEYDA